MYQLINNALNKYSSNIAYIYVENDQVVYSQTFNNVKSEIKQLQQLFNSIPKGALVAIQLGKMPCLIPVIISLLEFKIAFILLEAHELIDFIKESLKPYALIECKSHGKENDDLPSKKCKKFDRIIQTTGCSFNFHKFHWPTVEESEKSLSYQGICYVITTSGTLGRRKVVKVPEASIFCNIKSFVKLFDITTNDVIYFGTPLSFDPSLIELFLALTTGACLLATSKQIKNNPQKLIETLFAHKAHAHEKCVTFMQMCPSVFVQFSAEQIHFILHKSGLRTLGLGGEQFPYHILRPEQTPKACIYNFYGITEVSCWASVQKMFYGQEVSLGDPLDETVYQIEKADGTFVNLWEEGEVEGNLRIGSTTRICYIDDEVIDEVNNDNKCVFRSTSDLVKVSNGRVYFIGRVNDVIKRYGHRISLLKVQELIYSATQIVNQCIFHREKLICFFLLVLPKNNVERTKTIDKIRVKLLKSLAPELMPDCLDILTELPVKENNGKLDTHALKQMANGLLIDATSSRSSTPKRDLFEQLWRKYLGIATSSTSSNTFWDSGGTSIAAMQLSQEYQDLTSEELNRSVLDLSLQEALSFIGETGHGTGNIQTKQSPMFKIIWKVDMKACIDTSPIVCSIRGRSGSCVAVGNFAHTFSVFDAESGDTIASIDLPNVIESAALVVDHYFYVPCFDGMLHCLQLHIPALETRGSFDNVWGFQTSDRLKNKPVLFDELIVFGSYDGHIYALTKDGSLKWKRFLGEPITAEIKVAHEVLFVATLKGSINCLSSVLGAILWTYKARAPIFTSPEISSERDCIIFLDIQGNMYNFSMNNGSLLWTFEPTASAMKTFGAMLLWNNRIFLGTQEGNVNILNFADGSCILQDTIGLNAAASSITTKPLIITIKKQTYIIVVSSTGRIHMFLLNGDSITLKAVYFLPNECFSSPQLCNKHENRFYLGCRDNHLYCLEINAK